MTVKHHTQRVGFGENGYIEKLFGMIQTRYKNFISVLSFLMGSKLMKKGFCTTFNMTITDDRSGNLAN